MSNSDELMHELETHVQRILEYHNPKQPYAQVLNVTEKRGSLVNALARFIDQRIQEHLTKFAQDQARRQDPARRPNRG
jgi:hypothetical protein